MIRICAEPTCGYLVRWQTRCPLHRPTPQTSAGVAEGADARAVQPAAHRLQPTNGAGRGVNDPRRKGIRGADEGSERRPPRTDLPAPGRRTPVTPTPTEGATR